MIWSASRLVVLAGLWINLYLVRMMEGDVAIEWNTLIQAGTGGVLLLVLWLMIKDGSIRTKFEMTAREERTKRAEDMVDTLIPAVQALTASVNKQTEQIGAIVGVAEALMQELRVERAHQRARGAS